MAGRPSRSPECAITDHEHCPGTLAGNPGLRCKCPCHPLRLDCAATYHDGLGLCVCSTGEGDRMADWVTKDSGRRHEYASGMVRDTQDGKPRFDLLWPRGIPFDEQFLTRCAALMARGAEKYGDRNWEKGNSEDELERAISSAARHFAQWIAGETDEDHAAAVFFNLMQAETLRFKLSSGAQ